jgi:hypothetical protein
MIVRIVKNSNLKIPYTDQRRLSSKAHSGHSCAKIRIFNFWNPSGAEKDVFSLVRLSSP